MSSKPETGGLPSAGRDLGEFALKRPYSNWPGTGPAAYALYLQSDFEQFPRGTAFIVDPDEAVESGDWAVVCLSNGQRCVRVVQHGPGESLRLLSTCPCAHDETPGLRSEVRVLHKVVVIFFPDRETPGRGGGRNAQPSSGR